MLKFSTKMSYRGFWFAVLVLMLLDYGLGIQEFNASAENSTVPVIGKPRIESFGQQIRTAFKVLNNMHNSAPDRKQLFQEPPALPVPEKPLVNLEPAILAPTDMPGDMLTFATETALKAATSFTGVADMAEYLRMKFEARFPSTSSGNWQASVGTSFAASIRKRTGTGFYAKIKNIYFLLFASP
ncbi:hypothetical protein RvY_01429 [Ramazzottius varieornatus]|uniref:Uncharacterized protein n=1 Tax=Ramazzottius varieornatus TaxID=947166 RepID=A0A1D1UK71_RAMVA|nr:hypothetical protein RvY_01429 [Ramazzottius varieornatus]